MFEDIITTMEAEEADLVRKLDAVRQFLAAYRGVSGSKPALASAKVDGKAARKTRALDERMDKFGPYGQRIVDYADRMLPGSDANPIPTRSLVERLEAIGLTITGTNKVNSLSALLARSTKMKGWGRAGWTRAVSEPGEMYGIVDEMVRNENGEAEASPDAEDVDASSYIEPQKWPGT